MRCSHASTLKLIDWLVRCHGQVGEAARGREMVRRIRLVLDGRWDVYMGVSGGGGCGALKRSRTHARSYTHSWPALAWFWSVACGHGGHRSQLSACDGLIDTDTPSPPNPNPPLRHSQTTTSISCSLQPSTSLLPSTPPQQPAYAWWACLRGDVLRRGSQSPSWLWPAFEHALLSPSLSRSVAFIFVSRVSY